MYQEAGILKGNYIILARQNKQNEWLWSAMTAHLSHATGPRAQSTEPCLVFMSAWTFELIIQQLHAVAYLLRWCKNSQH